MSSHSAQEEEQESFVIAVLETVNTGMKHPFPSDLELTGVKIVKSDLLQSTLSKNEQFMLHRANPHAIVFIINHQQSFSTQHNKQLFLDLFNQKEGNQFPSMHFIVLDMDATNSKEVMQKCVYDNKRIVCNILALWYAHLKIPSRKNNITVEMAKKFYPKDSDPFADHFHFYHCTASGFASVINEIHGVLKSELEKGKLLPRISFPLDFARYEEEMIELANDVKEYRDVNESSKKRKIDDAENIPRNERRKLLEHKIEMLEIYIPFAVSFKKSYDVLFCKERLQVYQEELEQMVEEPVEKNI